MSELWEPADAFDARMALSVDGRLHEANEAGVLTSADVHVARTLAQLTGETDEDVLLAAALTVRAVRAGSVCLDLATVGDIPLPDGVEIAWPETSGWAAAVADSRLVAAGVLRWEHDLLYLDRYHEQESQVLDDLVERTRSQPAYDDARITAALQRILAAPGFSEQAEACARAARQWTTVLTGGPGTGKTTAVAALLATLREAQPDGAPLRVALTAPTGKASARLRESVRNAAAPPRPDAVAPEFSDDERAWLSGLEAMTLHRLLRRDPGNTTRFRHHRGNRLPHDVVVVDETSMVSLTMMARLLEAVRPDCRLVLVGDPDQLASVEAGAVLGDLVEGYDGRDDSPVAALSTTHRFGEHIGALATALRDGDADAALAVLAAGHDEVVWIREEDPSVVVRNATLPAALAVRSAAERGDAEGALVALDRHRLLCAHRDGPFGVRHWNRRVESWLAAETGDPLYERYYLGRPLLVTANDYALGVLNGDTGVVVAPTGSGVDGVGRVAMRDTDGLRFLAPSRLGEVDTMHAMTIHKSQGSQVDEVTVLLPDEESRLLTRELFYTAVTRARYRVRVVGPESAVRAAVERQARRASGLAARLRG